jgi:hypothetical protein
MSRISFQSEQPSELDLFPGSSHDKVAKAICNYITEERNSRVIGLDGEFGSGKSSILKMLKSKLLETDTNYKVWFFDCEQNYQGSIKSNFIELFTEELIKTVGSDKIIHQSLRNSRDKALGRHFTYTKNTISRISPWALFMIVALFFSTSSFKELFAVNKVAVQTPIWLSFLHFVSLISPVLVLIVAWFKLRKTKVGEEAWSIFHLFKGGSDDTVTEKIQVAKEVTPLDLKRTLDADLKLLKDTHYVVVLDNLDRLPKDSLRTVWSDLEIFTCAAEDNRFTVIVPFCSNKVAKYLAADHERTYDSRDFISKKFPVVFRAPPVVSAGWKDGFYKLWENTFPESNQDISEKCAILLQRHSPMAGKLVTPRLQKRFINDVAATALTLGFEVDLVCISAYLLLCKYGDLPLEESIREGGASEHYKKSHTSFNDSDLKTTQKFLDTYIGSYIDDGWQIQFLQIHFLADSAIAIAELIDEPLAVAIREIDSERFASLVTVFGFKDAFKRYLAADTYNADFLRVLGQSSEKISSHEFTSVISILNKENKTFQGDLGEDDTDFCNALKVCRLAGLNTNGLDRLKKEMLKSIKDETDLVVEEQAIEESKRQLRIYDALLDALGASPETIALNNASYFIHIFAESKDLKAIDVTNFKFTPKGIKSIHELIISLPDSEDTLAITEMQREFLLDILISTTSAQFGKDPVVQMTSAEAQSLASNLTFYPNSDAILFGLVLSAKTDKTIISTVLSQSFEDRTESQNAAVAVLLLVTQNFKELAKIKHLETVVESKVFKLLLKAAAHSNVLIAGLDEAEVGGIVAKVLAWVIKENAMWKLNSTQALNKFTKVISAVAPYGVDEQSVFEWLNDWQRHFKAEIEYIENMDPEFVRKLVSSTDRLFTNFKEGTFNFYSSAELNEEKWESIFLSESPNHRILLKYLNNIVDFKLGSNYRPAVIGVMRKIVSGNLDPSIRTNTAETIHATLEFCDQEQKNLLGTGLRDLIYSEQSSPEPVTWLLDNFGQIIVDIQPANTSEVGKLMVLLEYVKRHSRESDQLCRYLDERANQIAKYRYSNELREAMAVSIANLRKATPKLFKTFDKKSYFKERFKEMFDPGKNKEKETLETEE